MNRREKKADATSTSSDVVGKLGRLLETEASLEAMLKGAKQQAQQLVDDAQRKADEQIRGFELHLESEHRRLRETIAQEREQTIQSIRREAHLETARLQAINDEQLRQLAEHVVAFLLDPFEREESS